MKFVKHIMLFLLAVAMLACNEGIDPITKVDQGTDETAPAIEITYPKEGTKLKVSEAVTPIKIQFIVTDDIEIASVKVQIDGTEIATYSQFIDYRRLVEDSLNANINNGVHALTITATDLQGKTATSSVNFEKVPPYTPLFAGEILYMPFENDYMNLVSQNVSTAVGTPSFDAEGFVGASYKGATDAYLSLPLTGFDNTEFSAVFWYKSNATPDRSGIINVSPAGESRQSGFRFFREGSATEQRFKLNVGTGTGETWNDGGTINPSKGDWVHLAFTISGTTCAIYINGELAAEVPNAGIDWTGCDLLVIGSGAPNFTYWQHNSDLSLYDELRIFNKALTKAEIQTILTSEGGTISGYQPKYDGETFYMPFNNDFVEAISGTGATIIGTPGLVAEGKSESSSYIGATDSHLEYPAAAVLSSQFSAAFWMKVNAEPTRAGIITIGPEDTENAGYPAVQNKRTNGLRFFREGNATEQRFKLNVGTGTTDVWNDGGTIDPSKGEWVHLAFTISDTKNVIYINGELARESAMTATIDWTGCDILSIMSGVPRFTEWEHYSDLSFMDDLRFFNKALSIDEVKQIMSDGN